MADDKRLQILKLISAQLETITVANGYQHDLSTDRVFRGRTDFGSSDADYVVTLLENPSFSQDFLQLPEIPVKKNDWLLFLQGFIKPDPVHATDPAYIFSADCQLALSALTTKDNQLRVLGGLATGLTIFPGVVLPLDKEKSPNQVQFILQMIVMLVDDSRKLY